MHIRPILGAILCAAVPQLGWADGPAPPCETSTGLPGVLFQNLFGYVAVPQAFDRAVSADGSVTIVPEVIGALGPLVRASATGETQLRFFTGETLAFECTVRSARFDPDTHDLARLTEGRCDWTADKDLPHITGLGRLYTTQTAYQEIASSDSDVADLSSFSSNTFYALGKTAGVTTFLTLGDGGVVQAQCPLVVQEGAVYFERNPVQEDDLCRDSEQRPARLAVGQTVSINFDPSGPLFQDIGIADPSVADISAQSPSLYLLKGVSPGITNVIGLTADATFHHECMVVVED